MSFKNIEVALASEVVQNGTFTATYPDNTSAGDYATYGHKLYAAGLQAMFTQDAGGMSVSFGASTITVTYKGATGLPAGKAVMLQLNMRGADDNDPLKLVGMQRMTPVIPFRIDIGSPDTADADGIVASQNLGDTEGLATGINGAYADPDGGGFALLDVPRNVVAAWTGTAILTVTGEDEYGATVVEKSASGTSLTGKKAFKKVTHVSTNADVTALTVGTGDVLGLPVFIEKVSRLLQELQDEVVLTTGTLVPGVQTVATATTGDVRGTYDPAAACNGALSFALITLIPDPTYKGVEQYDG